MRGLLLLKNFVFAMLIAFPLSLAGVCLIFSVNIILAGRSGELFLLASLGFWTILKLSVLMAVIGSLVTIFSPGRVKR